MGSAVAESVAFMGKGDCRGQRHRFMAYVLAPGWLAILEEWARRIAQWRRRADALVYFNNDWEGLAVDNARSLRRRFRNE